MPCAGPCLVRSPETLVWDSPQPQTYVSQSWLQKSTGNTLCGFLLQYLWLLFPLHFLSQLFPVVHKLQTRKDESCESHVALGNRLKRLLLGSIAHFEENAIYPLLHPYEHPRLCSWDCWKRSMPLPLRDLVHRHDMSLLSLCFSLLLC